MSVTRPIIKAVARFLKEEDGPTAVEYAVMLALICVACLGAFSRLTTNVGSSFNRSSAAIRTATAN